MFMILGISVLLLVAVIQQFKRTGLTGFSTNDVASENVKLAIKKNFLNSMLLLANGIILLVIFLYYKKMNTQEEKHEEIKTVLRHPKEVRNSKLEILIDQVNEMNKHGFTQEEMRKNFTDYNVHPIVVSMLVHEETDGKLHEILAFMKKQLERGKAETQVRRDLIEKGWQQEVVNLAFE